MAIPGQENINIGLPNDPQNSDSLYTAFRATQNNFTTLFNTSSPLNNIIPGTGIGVEGVSNTSNSTIKITNTGVTSLVAGNNVTITAVGGSPSTAGALVISATGGGGGGGGVTSVGVASNTLSVVNSPIVGAGNIIVDLPLIANLASGNYQNPNVSIDRYGRITSIANGTAAGVTSVSVAAGTGIAIAGSPITSSGTITVTNTGVTSIVAGTGIVINQSNGAVTISSNGGGGGGGGTVTRVGVVSNTLSVSGSPIVSSGNIIIDLPQNIVANNITANTANIANVNANRITATELGSTPVVATVYSAVGTAHFQTRTSRGTVSAPSAVLPGDSLFAVNSSGYTTFSGFQGGGSIGIVANGSAANSSSLIPSDVILRSVTSSNTISTLKLTTDGEVISQGQNTIRYANATTDIANTLVTARSRGTTSTPANIQTGDAIYRHLSLGYTGNGLLQADGVFGFASGASIEVLAAGLPAAPGGGIPSNVRIRTTSTGNTLNDLVYTSQGNLVIPGIYNGDGGGLSNITGANVTGQVSNALVAGTVYTNAQPNITSVGTLTSLSVSGNANITGNANVGNLDTSGTVTAVSTISGGNILTNGFVRLTHAVNTQGEIQLTDGVGNSFVVQVGTGIGTWAGSGSLNLITSSSPGGNVGIFVAQTEAARFTNTGLSVVSNISANSLSITGNASAGNLNTTGNLSVTGNAIISGNLTVDGNLTYLNVNNISVEDPIIQLQTGPNDSPLTSNTGKDVGVSLNYYDSVAKSAWMGWDLSNSEISFGADVNIANEIVTFNQLANIRSGNADLGNTATANYLSGTLTTAAQPNVTSVGTLSTLSVTGNVDAGNADLGNLATANYISGTLTTAAQPNITSVGTLSSLSVTGNVDAGNLVLSTGDIFYTPRYGSFYSNVTQTNPVANTAMAMTLNNTSSANGVSIVSNSQITINKPGLYNIQFSAQVTKTGGGTSNVDIWLNKDGAPVDWTNTTVYVTSGNPKVAAWNFVENVTVANTYFELMWSSADTLVALSASPAGTGPTRPGIPSLIVTVTPVGA